MFPLWDVAIAPVLTAARARRVVEIGALRGETTVRMLESLGPDAELHVIDPAPGFDPEEHEREFGGRYVFHQALSLDVLPTLEPMDAALIDGDHNWYTVYNELRLLAEGARDAGAPLPVLVMHDVGWPYGRRDLYYDPDTIPEEHRQPYAQQGMRPGSKRLLSRHGLNPTMNNAMVEGGPRNGVMTALDDFIAEYPKPLRRLVIPIYFGLAIVVEEERLEREPDLRAALEHLESSDGRHDLLQVSEDVRLRAMIFQHNTFYQRSQQLERAVRRHLDTVKASLLNEHYLDHEARFHLLSQAVVRGRPLAVDQLRDPTRNNPATYRSIERQRLGPSGPEGSGATSFVPYTAMGRPQLDRLEQCLDAVRAEDVPGDVLECGTGRGGGAIFMRAYLDAHELAGRDVWVADRFRASPDSEKAPRLPRQGVAGLQADLNLVRDGFDRFGLLDERVRFLQGPPSSTLAAAETEQLALLRIGRGATNDAQSILDEVYDTLAVGAFVLVEDGEGCRKQIDAFRGERGIEAPLERIDASAVYWRKSAGDAAAPSRDAAAEITLHPPLAPAAPADALDLTVVVVFYNMRREAERTLRSLSRAYQEDVDDLAYEVVAIENGSRDDEKLGEAFVAGFGPEFRYIDLGEDSSPSPVSALNHGIRTGRGRAFALMIDGAHVLTPGVLRFGVAGLSTYSPAIVATQQWYVGPGDQGDAMENGYDQDFEDRLFDKIRWPSAGYRLFEIGHFIGDRDWLDGVWESNCMFVDRRLLEQVGGFDESFSMPGGGYANLELYERLGAAPGVTVATILGEGSFHQVHGGTTTNQADPAERRSRVFGYSQHYAELRGRPFKGPNKPMHFVGRLPSPAARRTKSRRLSTAVFDEVGRAGIDGVPEDPTPVPDELKVSFTESVWRSLPWRNTSWLGRRISSAPTDLLAYQEVIAEVRPDWVVETGTGDGTRALFLASVCELVGHGQVLSVGNASGELPQHPRLHFVEGVPHEQATVTAVGETVGDGRAVVLLGSCVDRPTTQKEFDAYAPLVATGAYLIVTDTVVNGNPVWPGFGPGPREAVKQLLALHGEFVQDPSKEKYSLTFNPGGFLRKVR